MLKSVLLFMPLVVIAGLLSGPRAEAQAALYGEFSGTDFTNLIGTDYAFGGSTGVLVEGPRFLRRLVLAGDVQGRFVSDSVEMYDSVVLGPRLEFPLKRGGFVPYAEFAIGFARYNNNGLKISTTDSTIQFNGGLAKKISARWDAVGEFSYSQFFALGGEFNPKTVSVGAMYHFAKR